MDDFYALVDHETQTITAPGSTLQENWMNIFNLNALPYEKLTDLSWAGHPDRGMLKLSDPSIVGYTYNSDWLHFTCQNIKEFVSDIRKEKESEVVSFEGGLVVKIDEKTKVALNNKKALATEDPTYSCVWKFENSMVVLSAEQILSLANGVESYVQSCFDVEYAVFQEIDTVSSLEELCEVSLDLTWPSTNI